MEQTQNPTMGATINKRTDTNRTTALERTVAYATDGSLNAFKTLSSTVKRYMRDPVKICFGLLKIQVKF